MPTSHYEQITDIMRLITCTRPNKLLDIGVGFGKYGFLSREYLEFWDKRQEYHNWKTKIDGIEVFEDYITPAHDFIYDKIFMGDVIEILPTLKEKYDLILLIDVFEHFDYEDGLRILQACQRCGKNILISVPNDIGHQGDSFGNAYETHRFQWEEKHFKRFSDIFLMPDIGGSLIVYIGEDAQKVCALWKKWKWKNSSLRKEVFRIRKRFVRGLELFHLKTPIKRLLGYKGI